MKTLLSCLPYAAAVTVLLFATKTGAQSGSTYRFQNKYATDTLSAKIAGGSGDLPAALISIATDLSRSAAGSGEDKSSVSNGKLGIDFVNQYIYGNFSVAVLANDRESVAGNLADTAFFYNNLLLAQNSNGGIREVSGSLGINKLFPAIDKGLKFKRKSLQERKKLGIPLYWVCQNLGFYAGFRVSSQIWVKDSFSTDILLSASSFLVSLQLFNLKMESPDWGYFQLLAFGGRTVRRLGGDYALESTPREIYLGTNKTVFKGWEYGVKMEVGPFYGRASFTEFSIDDNIPGFSGPQLAVSLGAVINLNLKAFKR